MAAVGGAWPDATARRRSPTRDPARPVQDPRAGRRVCRDVAGDGVEQLGAQVPDVAWHRQQRAAEIEVGDVAAFVQAPAMTGRRREACLPL